MRSLPFANISASTTDVAKDPTTLKSKV
uniref:Uncharacterized protein n=1 Tax=Arundo donax TaxID=35708 RepID=A0A0A9FCJ0_ARUDO